jgi:hypothetical protein
MLRKHVAIRLRAVLFAALVIAPLVVHATCVNCHETVTPGIVAQHNAGKMARVTTCVTCHGSGHTSEADVARAKMPTPETCMTCHPAQVSGFRKGKHAMAWAAMEAMPMLRHQPAHVTGAGLAGCSGCHKIGDKPPGASGHYGSAQCDSCHTRHTFSKNEARDPRACRTCHMGFDHPQWEMWSTSKHGTLWEIDPGSGRGPTCQTCHMAGGSHEVLTSWGFLAVRLPEDDPEWLRDRVTILQALGVLDGAGRPTERLDVVKAARIARLSKEEFAEPREKMLKICAGCHSRNFAETKLATADGVVREVDRTMATSIRTVSQLYRDGHLRKPDGWRFAPDLLQFYDARSSIEQEVHLMFLEYRMRAIQGSFHANPDYMHWYGWAKLREAATRIEEASDRLRARRP